MPVSSLLQPLPNDFWSNDVTTGSLPLTWGHVTSFPVTWLPPPASYSLVWSQTQCMKVFDLLQLLPGDFRSNDVASGSLPVSGGHVTWYPVTWLSPAASYSLEGSQTHSIQQFSAFHSHFQVTSRSLPVTWDHVTSFTVTWLPQPASNSLVKSQTHSIHQFSAFYSHFQMTCGQLTSLPVTSCHLRSRDVIFCHLTASSCKQQPCRKSNTECVSFRPSTATSRWDAVKWRHFRVTSSHLR